MKHKEVNTMSPEYRWNAVLDRDRAADGQFVYAVRSTGIYCKPSCPSRKARREQVEFFTQPQEAESAGYRPCKRCRPTETAAEVEIVAQVCALIAEAESAPTLEELGAAVGMSPFHLQRVFKAVMNLTPRQYAEAQRLERFKRQLRERANVAEALYEAGFGSSSRGYEGVRSKMGMTPATYRKGGAGMHIIYTLTDCSLGRLLVAGTQDGICAVLLGDHDESLIGELGREYHAATIEHEVTVFQEWVAAIVSYLEGQSMYLDLPLDVQATAFQWRVWEALRSIPPGTTRTYSEVAAMIGQPTAARAVANACASNRVAMLIPCHRVVREDGGLGGYRWGVERKEALLTLEADAAGRPEAGH